MENWYAPAKEQVAATLETNETSGLTTAQYEERKSKYGPNKLAGKKKETTLRRFLRQFKDVMIIILLVAAAVSFVVALNGHEDAEFLEPVVIIGIVVMNAILGMTQESKAERALEALQKMTAPRARVLRDGKEQLVDTTSIVPGDIILVEAGDFVSADARLLEARGLKVEESALTGESVPEEKDADAVLPKGTPLGDRLNMIYSGCSVTYGRAKAVVVATGMDTEMGKIAGLLAGEKRQQTPLQKITSFYEI